MLEQHLIANFANGITTPIVNGEITPIVFGKVCDLTKDVVVNCKYSSKEVEQPTQHIVLPILDVFKFIGTNICYLGTGHHTPETKIIMAVLHTNKMLCMYLLTFSSSGVNTHVLGLPQLLQCNVNSICINEYAKRSNKQLEYVICLTGGRIFSMIYSVPLNAYSASVEELIQHTSIESNHTVVEVVKTTP
jgi:hypothetical protein